MCGFTFHFVNGFFCSAKAFKFDIPFVYFYFYFYCLGGLIFAYILGILGGHVLKSLNHFEFISGQWKGVL